VEQSSWCQSPIACWIIVAVGVYRIGQVVWALMCVDCEHHQCQLELDPVHHWQPVQLLQGRTHVIAQGQAKDETCSCVLHPLKRCNGGQRQTTQNTVAVV